jgi:cytosolic 5'-nucleotidase 3
MENIIISNPETYEKIKKAILDQGAENLHILSDFDKTFTKAFVNGKKIPSIISELRNGESLSKEYAKKAHELFDYYHPFEEDNSLTPIQKKEKMKEWWTKHFELLIKEKLNKGDLEKIVKSGNVQLRRGIEELMDLLKEKQIPLIILSASGIGDVIPMYLKQKNINYQNIYTISNFYKWDSKGNAIGVKKPIVNSANKDETTLEKLPFYSKLLKRKNIILLGDSLDDSKMAQGFPYENILKIGFLNEKVKERLEDYKKKYDVIIPSDGTMNFINEFLKQI